MASSAAAQGNPSFNSTPNSLPNSNPIPISTPASRKRPLEYAQSSPYFKIRLTLKNLRPLFLQVIHAPEFQHAEAVHGLQEKMKLLVELCKEMATEAPYTRGEKASEEFVKLEKEDGLALGSCVVGGSAFGWNFVTYISSKAEYYGRSKESFRASKPKSDG